MAEEEAAAMERMKRLCRETSVFRKDFYEKMKHGWLSMMPLDDIKMVHFLYRIFYMAPNDQDVQLFEWHNFFDIFHDFPMRKHTDDPEDLKMCATMVDIITWFKKTDGERKCLRRIGKTPNLIHCLGCKTEDEKEFIKPKPKVEVKESKEEENTPSVQSVSVKAAKRLGMSVLETADVAITRSTYRFPPPTPHGFSNQLHKLLTTSSIALPLRRSTSALLYPVTEGLEQNFSKDLETRRKEIANAVAQRSCSPSPVRRISQKKECTKVKHFPTSIVMSESGLPMKSEEKPSRKNGVVNQPKIKRNDPLRESAIKRMNYERLLKASEWVRIDDEVKMTLVEIKIRQRILLIDHYIAGWQKDNSKDSCLTKWLFDDTTSPLHTRQFANFEYYHFIPSHSHSVLTQLDQKQLLKYTADHLSPAGSATSSEPGYEPHPNSISTYTVLCEPRLENNASEVYL